MNFALETRHKAIMIGAVIVSAAAAMLVLQLLPVDRVTVLAFPIAALAVVLDTLGTTAERRRTPLKLSAWLCLCVAAFAALWPLREPLSLVQATVAAWTDAGWPLPRALWEGLRALQQYSAPEQRAMMLSAALGASGLALAVSLPFVSIFTPRIGPDRKSRSGPWRATWMKPRDIAFLARNTKGLPLVLHKDKLLRYAKNDAKGWRGGHHLIVAGTRGGKGVSAVIPAILDHQGPVVVLDVKGENFAVTRRHRQELGREVAVLNPFGLIEDSKDQFNPLDYIRPHELARDVDLIADGLIIPETGDGAHFSDIARRMVAAAVEVVATHEDSHHRNFVAVADLLLSPGREKRLKAWADNKELVGPRVSYAATTFLELGDNERGSVVSTMSKAFDWMASEQMRRFLSGSSFRLDDLLDDRLDMFVVVPMDQIKQQAVFMRLFINIVLGVVVRQDGRRKVKAPIQLVLDEFVRMGRMEQIMNVATVAAGAGVEALFVTQDTGQVEKAYGRDDARSIFGSCITKRVFNLNDIDTADWAARHLGESTVYSQQVRVGKGPNDGQDLSYSEQRQRLMTGDQILQMGADEALLLVGNHHPLKAKLCRYHESPIYAGRFDPNPVV